MVTMTWKILAKIWLILMAGLVLTGAARAEALNARMPVPPQLHKVDSVGLTQILITTPTPRPDASDELVSPVKSEVGRDLGIVVGAAILVIIVIGGVVVGFRRSARLKARD
jgi:hypothetical protein